MAIIWNRYIVVFTFKFTNIFIFTFGIYSHHLGYVKSNIAPLLSNVSNFNDNPKEVSSSKLIDLWINKRKKAIEAIKNDGLWPVFY